MDIDGVPETGSVTAGVATRTGGGFTLIGGVKTETARVFAETGSVTETGSVPETGSVAATGSVPDAGGGIDTESVLCGFFAG